MELTQQNEVSTLEPDSPTAGLVVGMSSAVRAHAVFAAAVGSVVGGVRPAFDPACDVSLVDVAEVTEGRTGGTVLAVTVHPTVTDTRRVLGLGVSGVIDRRGDPNSIAPALTAAVTGHTVLPRNIASALLVRLEDPPPTVALEPADLELLQDLASGMTLDEVALVRDRSTRTIRRDLRALWKRMGVTGRAQGLVCAARWGLIG